MTPTALQRIKEIERDGETGRDVVFLLKAFNVMREIADNAYEVADGEGQTKFHSLSEEFEERMSK
jgi:hypothetical protein